MSDAVITCDQAIFTSIKTPMGEGYRIVAASKGLRPDEKQAITRSSPSLDSLCVAEGEQPNASDHAVACYLLPRGRTCIAYTCYAGDEHTGRGGKRVYTHNVVFECDRLQDCGYNPFAVLRAMHEAGLSTPQLKPDAVLPELSLVMTPTALDPTGTIASNLIGDSWRAHLLNALLADESLVVNLPNNWLGTAETLLLSIPGPLRHQVSFGAGMRYSVARTHRLSLVHDDGGKTKSRTGGHNVAFIDPTEAEAPAATPSAWTDFVNGYLESDGVAALSRRTSLAFNDVSPNARERVGRMYVSLDQIADASPVHLLDTVSPLLAPMADEIEGTIAHELVVATQRAFVAHLKRILWEDACKLWPDLCDVFRRSTEGSLFALPLIEEALALATSTHPTVAAEAALMVANCGTNAPTVLVDQVLTKLADWADSATDEEIEQLPRLCERWAGVRPNCPIVERIQHRCSSAHRA